jgi:starch synthase
MMESAHVAFVHHANQYLITDGYDNRDGIGRIAEGYASILRMHERHAVPAELHLSGTLLESLAWHEPELLKLIRSLVDGGLLSLIGGTYADNVMTEWPRDFNRRQLEEFFLVCESLLGCPPKTLRTCWIPERVWDESLAGVLTEAGLPNGGYRAVLLDDRLLFPAGVSRARFDAKGPYDFASQSNGRGDHSPRHDPSWAETRRLHRIAGGNGLVAIPISADLRYWIPPSRPEHWRLLEDAFADAAQAGSGSLLVYADDLEKTAGVGGWSNDPAEFDALLRWIAADRSRVHPVLLGEWCELHPPSETRPIEGGTFFELAVEWAAGEDYRGWTDSRSWAPYRRILENAHDELKRTEGTESDARLTDLAWKHLMASSHETGWQEPSHARGPRAPSPWARSLAGHARATLAMTEAARRAGSYGGPRVELRDVDDDGFREVVLQRGDAYAVLAPEFGGRIVYLFHRAADGFVLSIGNPTDHWNFQESLNRFMDCPPNHPGGLADVGFEHDPYRVANLTEGDGHATVEMVNEGSGPMAGTHKTVCLPAFGPGLMICYRVPAEIASLVSQVCLSPDYLGLLRGGRRSFRPRKGRTWSGAENGGAWVWLGLGDNEPTEWVLPPRPETGHGANVAVHARGGHFHLAVGWGPGSDAACQSLIHRGRRLVHEMCSGIAPTGDQSSSGRVISSGLTQFSNSSSET